MPYPRVNQSFLCPISDMFVEMDQLGKLQNKFLSDINDKPLAYGSDQVYGPRNCLDFVDNGDAVVMLNCCCVAPAAAELLLLCDNTSLYCLFCIMCIQRIYFALTRNIFLTTYYIIRCTVTTQCINISIQAEILVYDDISYERIHHSVCFKEFNVQFEK